MSRYGGGESEIPRTKTFALFGPPTIRILMGISFQKLSKIYAENKVRFGPSFFHRVWQKIALVSWLLRFSIAFCRKQQRKKHTFEQKKRHTFESHSALVSAEMNCFFVQIFSNFANSVDFFDQPNFQPNLQKFG